MGLYEKYFLPKILNAVMKSPELTRLRQEWVPQATGRVLEVGIGSGLNIPFYKSDVHVTGVDPSVELLAYAEEVARDAKLNVEFIPQGCEDLPVAANTFDSALVTWTFCTIPDPLTALTEIRRVLKPGGKLIFVEHGKAKEEAVIKWQNRLNPLWKTIAGGCNLNRQPDTAILEQGFKFDYMDEGYVPGPKFATYNYRGIATPL